MRVTDDELRRVERLHVRAWPTTETERIGGWLWRYSGGASRANSLSTIEFGGPSLAAACENTFWIGDRAA